MPNRHQNDERQRRLKMKAVQLAGEFPANSEDAFYILRRIQKILVENVYDNDGGSEPGGTAGNPRTEGS